MTTLSLPRLPRVLCNLHHFLCSLLAGYWQSNFVAHFEVSSTPTATAKAALATLDVSGTSDETELYPRWRALLPNLNDGATAHLIVKPDRASLFDTANLRPDLVAYTKGAPETAFYVELAGDLKAKAAPFLAKDYLQIERYAATQLHQQPQRSFFYCFVANTDAIEFFKFARSDGSSPRLPYTRSQPMQLKGEGGLLLLRLLCASPAERGTQNLPLLTLPDGVLGGGLLVLEKQIGQGASATAFQCRLATRQLVVAKLFKTLAPLQCEVRYLRLLRDKLACDQRIPTLLHYDEQQLLVVISPLATKLSLSPNSWELQGASNALHSYLL